MASERTTLPRAICQAAGWAYCEEHDRPLVKGCNPCGHLHWRTEPEGCTACSDNFDWCRVCGRAAPEGADA